MNNLTLKITTLICLSLTFYTISAQTPKVAYEKWELGLQGGVSQGQDDLNNFGKYENNLAGNLLLRYHFNPNLDLRANVLVGKITGNDADYDFLAGRGFTFSSPVTEASLLLEQDILGHLRYRQMSEGRFRRIVSPYGFAGFGFTLTNPKINYNEANQSPEKLAQINEDKLHNTAKSFFPGIVGLGVKFDLSERWLLQVEGGLRIVWNDKLDGVSASGNPQKGDTYSFIGLGLCYRFPAVKDADHDGVPDEQDACPDMAGTAATMGCPDTDGDGIADKDDACPNEKGLAGMQGCPDADGDGIADKDDACPNEKGTSATKGCPDIDGDGIADKDDACPNQKGTLANGGCPDTDGDGIIDKDDACPLDKGIARFKGCPDTDGDGIEDKLDKCPTVPGVAANFGCPPVEVKKEEIKKEDKEILEAAKYGVQFESGKSVLKASSYKILDQVAAVMNRYPAYHMAINGYTDSIGEESTNLKLSKARTKACLDYLIKKGIPASRMTATGFGEKQPVATNLNAAGRAQNRRVEFLLTPQ